MDRTLRFGSLSAPAGARLRVPCRFKISQCLVRRMFKKEVIVNEVANECSYYTTYHVQSTSSESKGKSRSNSSFKIKICLYGKSAG